MLRDRRRRVGGYLLGPQIRPGSNGIVFRSGTPFGRLVVTLVADDFLPAKGIQLRAEAVAGLRHKSIVPLYDFGSDDGSLYFVTKYVDGETLAGVLATEGRLPPVDATRIASEILDGLAAAHSRGLVHGRLTPASVLVSAWSRAMITDLAIPSARPLGEPGDGPTDESPDMAAGALTLMDLPPEPLEGGEPDVRDDIYSVGALLFKMLTGKGPTRQGHGGQIESTTDWPPSRIEAVTPALEATVLKALAPEPDNRFSTAAEMRAALLGFSQRKSALREALVAQSASAALAVEPTERPGPRSLDERVSE